MKLHKVTLSNINTEERLEYLLNLSEDEAFDVFDVMELLSELHELVHGGKWNAIACLAV